MTLMGTNLLDEIINDQNCLEAHKILYSLDEKLFQVLSKQKDSQVDDGMDLTVLVFDENAQQVHFSGAKNPLYLVREGEMLQYKGSIYPIGGKAQCWHININRRCFCAISSYYL